MSNFLNGLKNFLLDILETVVIALTIFLIIYMFAFQPHEVNGQSMDGLDNFHDGQYILTDKVTYKMREPERGEVIVFKYPLNRSFDYIKRIVGLPGEDIMIENNEVRIFNTDNPDGFTLNETSYLSSTVRTNGRAFLDEGQKVSIPEGKYFVMGDNREQSADSRTWGFVSRDEIIGRSLFRYWPPNEVGVIKNPIEN